MRNLINQIKAGLRANLYYLSLFASLAIPDICGAIYSEDGIASGEKFAEWFDKYVSFKYSQYFSGEDCYRFRCSLLHQGSSQRSDARYSRIIFVEPHTTSNVYHCNIINGALNIDVNIFCSDIIMGVEQWLNEVEHTKQYEINYSKFMRRYPKGLLPYIDGVPVIS